MADQKMSLEQLPDIPLKGKLLDKKYMGNKLKVKYNAKLDHEISGHLDSIDEMVIKYASTKSKKPIPEFKNIMEEVEKLRVSRNKILNITKKKPF